MFKKVTLIFSLCSSSAFSEEYFSVAPLKIQIKTNNAIEKFEQTLNNPERLLKRFKPDGAVITNKVVNQHSIAFDATKTIFFITKTAHVNGNLDSVADNSGCKKSETGLKLTLDLQGSDGLVYENIDSLEAKFCISNANPNIIDGNIFARIYKGTNYSSTTGSIAKGIIEAQINPLIKAMSDEILSLK